MNMQEFLAEHDTEYQAEQKSIASVSGEATAVLRKHFPIEDSNLNAPQVLAACVELFDLEDSKDAGQLYLEWLVEHYVGRKVAANMDDIKMVVEALKAAGFTEDSPYHHNDGDNKLFYIPHEEKLIFCTESQNTRYIFILFANRLDVRRYYDEYVFDCEKDDWKRKEEKVYTEKGIREAISQASWLTDCWSDCVPGSKYPQRPSLRYFKHRDFDPRYNDCRDIGYVLSYENLMSPRADGAIFYYPDVKTAFFYLRCAVKDAVAGFNGG